MAIKNRQPAAGGIVHADHGVQFTSWAFTNKIRSSGLMPSFGTIGDCDDCQAVFVESVLDSEVLATPATLAAASICWPRSIAAQNTTS